MVPPEVLACSELEALRSRTEDSILVAEVSRIFRRYIISAFRLPSEELTTTELQKALTSHGQIDAELIHDIVQFLRRSDEWKFAATPSGPQLGAVETALKLLDKCETARKQPISALQAQTT
jgi:hypothetical protein